MTQSAETMKNRLATRFDQFKRTPVPRGFASACEDLDIDVYEYDSAIAGLVSTYLKTGFGSEPRRIDFGDELDRRLDECEKRLDELKAYKNTITGLAKLLAECMNLQA